MAALFHLAFMSTSLIYVEIHSRISFSRHLIFCFTYISRFLHICSAGGHFGFLPELCIMDNTAMNIDILAWASVTKYHKLGALNNRSFSQHWGYKLLAD